MILTPDEMLVLETYRAMKTDGNGTMYVEFANHQCSKFERKEGGLARQINDLIKGPNGARPLRD